MGNLRSVTAVTAILCSIAWTPFANAHSGGHGHGHLTTWTAKGRTYRASFHSMRGADSIVLEGRGGRRWVVASSDLALPDRIRADRSMERILRANARTQSVQPALQRNTAAGQGTVFDASIVAIGLLLAGSLRSRRVALRMPAVLLVLMSTALLTSHASVKMQIVTTDPLRIDSSFAPSKPHVSTRWDANYFYVESDGMPISMPAMVGITAWQQQVPIPQSYFGTNAWAIPLAPVPAERPVSLDTALHTGAVAIAVNGLPIFNPENNRGEFSVEIGELDAFGGHCGRADDYHYHVAPVHLATTSGRIMPIAWALDGYPLYGPLEPDGSAMATLDANLGHTWKDEYHYHAVDRRPYMIASMRGKITIDRDQIVPQATTKGVRPFLQPLNGATITDYHRCDSAHYVLKYRVGGQNRWVNYRWTPAGLYTYTFVASDGSSSTQTYQRK